ncbi:site-2 protease family protein [Candidatus Saccharibacteria bacterium]|nr:site-2 protease family protein [Candidatus Saccharibacteria bacterium]
MSIDLGYIAVVFVVSIFSVILHELMHGVTAYLLGDQTAKLSGRLTLNPLKHIDPVMSIIVPVCLALIGAPVFGGAKPVPINTRNLKGGEWGFALVAIAGPLTNIILSFIFFLIGHFSGAFYGDSLGGMICSTGMFLNMGFALFNIIPIPPLDGSRVLYALAPDGVKTFMQNMERYGLIVIYAMIFMLGSGLAVYFMNGEKAILTAFYWIIGIR